MCVAGQTVDRASRTLETPFGNPRNWQMAIKMEVFQGVRKQEKDSGADQRTVLRGAMSAIIDISDLGQVIRWSRYFGTTRLQLCNAVAKVGSDPAVVQRLLRTR